MREHDLFSTATLLARLSLLAIAFCLIGGQSFGSDRLRLADVLDPLPELDAAIPSPAEVMNMEVGERHWYHFEIFEYLDTLAEASSRMLSLGEHARSYGGRPLASYAISSPANLERLDVIRQARQSLVDPKASIALETMPAVLHMGYSVHGNEPSAANATPLVAYYLTAAQDAALETQLENVVIILNPVFNPDGLDRFAHWTNSHRGLVPSADSRDREHLEPFVTGRTNYYWFDLNRDWLAHQHPESRGRLALFHEWKPNVQLDFHEQGSDRSYFFMPGKPERVNPLTPAINQALTDAIAAYHRRVFDKEGILYYSQEGYDDFFVGKGSTYPDLFGCVGILFEQPSSRGAHQDTQNGLLTFPISISNQFRTSLSSLAATAALKDELLQYQRDFYADSLKQGKSKGGYYLATANGDPTRLREFVRVLQGHQIEVEALAQSKKIKGKIYPAQCSIAIPLAQLHYPYLQTLWERRTEFEEDIFYDVSAWTLPLAFNLQHTTVPVKRVATKALPASFHTPAHANPLGESAVGYLIDWRDSASPALLYALLDAKANVRVATRPFNATLVGGEQREFGYGSLFVGKALNPAIPDKAMRLLRDAAAGGAPVFPAGSSSTRSGIDLGSKDFKVLEKPKVILVTGRGMNQYDVGEIWHLFDQRIRMPITMVDWTRLGSVSLPDYTHVLLTRDLGDLRESALNKLKAFVKGGGVLWAQEHRAVKWVIEKELAEGVWRMTEEEKVQQAREKAAESEQDDSPSQASPVERRPFADARDQLAFKQVNGAIFATSLDITHPIGYGYASEYLPVIRSGAKFLEPSSNAYSTPVQYVNDPLLAGYISEENLDLIANSASLVIDQQGQGAVVLALDNPSFRAFWWGTQRLLVNAVFFGELLVEPK